MINNSYENSISKIFDTIPIYSLQSKKKNNNTNGVYKRGGRLEFYNLCEIFEGRKICVKSSNNEEAEVEIFKTDLLSSPSSCSSSKNLLKYKAEKRRW